MVQNTLPPADPMWAAINPARHTPGFIGDHPLSEPRQRVQPTVSWLSTKRRPTEAFVSFKTSHFRDSSLCDRSRRRQRQSAAVVFATGGMLRRAQRTVKRADHFFSTRFRDPVNRAAEPWRRPGSNRQPPACKAGALPIELHPQTRKSEIRNLKSETGGSPRVP